MKFFVINYHVLFHCLNKLLFLFLPTVFQVSRDYDEEEKGYGSDRSEEREQSDAGSDSPPELPPAIDNDIDHQTVDMDMSD